MNPEASTVIVDARSSVGPIAWEATRPAGELITEVRGSTLDLSRAPSGHLEIEIASLTSGNRVYDSELQRRVDARLHPTARVELTRLAPVGDHSFHAEGLLTFHSITRPITGTLDIQLRDDGTLLVTGEQTIDIRDFNVPPPNMLMLKIYPDVHVHLVLQGRPVPRETRG